MNEIEIYLVTIRRVCKASTRSRQPKVSCPTWRATWPVAHIIGYEHTFVNMMKDLFVAISRGEQFTPDFRETA